MDNTLEHSDNILRMISEASPDVYIILDLDFRIQFMSRITRGIPIKKFIGMTLHSIMEKNEDKVLVREALEKALKTGKQVTFHTDYMTDEYNRIYHESVVTPVPANGKAEKLVVISRNITERQQSEELYQTFLKNMPISAFVHDGNKFLLVNPQFQKCTEYSEAELLNMDPCKLVHPADQKRVKQLINHKLAGKQVNPYELRIVTRSGQVRYIIDTISKINYRGKPVILGNSVDITQRMQAEKSLRQSEEKYKRLVGTLHEGILVIDKDGKIIFVNQHLSDMLGYSREEILGKRAINFTDEEGQAIFRNQLVRRRKGIKDQYDVSFIRKNGERINTTIATAPVTDNDGNFAGSVSAIIDISERKQVEEVLRFSDVAFKSIHESVIALDNNHRVTFWNKICEEMLGIKASEAIGKELKELITLVEIYPGQNDERRDKLLKEGYNREEQVYRTPKGDIWVDVHAQAIEDNGKRYGWVILAADITERKLADEELKLKAKMLDNAGESICVTDMDRKLLYANERFCNRHPYERAEIIGKKITELNAPITSIKFREVEEGLRKNGKITFEVIHLRQEGEPSAAEVHSRVIELGEKKVILNIERDITERKQMEKALKESENKFFKIFHTNPIPMAIISPHCGIINDVNKAFSELTGYKYEECSNKSISDLNLITTPENNELLIEIPDKDSKTSELELDIRLKSGETRTVLLSADSFTTDGAPYRIISLQDITHRKKIVERLQQSQILASLGTMTSGIAHEVNNPLGSILLFSELMMKNDVPPQMKKDLKIIHSEARRAAKIMSKLLSYKGAKFQKRRLNLQKTLRKVLDRHQYEQNVRNISVYTNLPDYPLYIKGDSRQLTQVFANLFLNAEEALSKRNFGTIIISARAERKWLKITIADDGPGIPESNLGRIFHPFFTTKKIGEGTGLGLSTCYNIIAKHEGLIHAENNEMGGATFIIELPLAEASTRRKVKREKTGQKV